MLNHYQSDVLCKKKKKGVNILLIKSFVYKYAGLCINASKFLHILKNSLYSNIIIEEECKQ